MTVKRITGNPKTVITGQAKIAVTSTAVQLPHNSSFKSYTIKAKSGNNASGVFIGDSNVTTTDDGTGNGYKLLGGESVQVSPDDSGTLWFNGTAGDIIYFIGN